MCKPMMSCLVDNLPESHPAGVALNSPGSRSAPWGHMRRGAMVYPEGVAQRCGPALEQPLRGRSNPDATVDPGCAARPWAVGCDPCGVGLRQWPTSWNAYDEAFPRQPLASRTDAALVQRPVPARPPGRGSGGVP